MNSEPLSNRALGKLLDKISSIEVLHGDSREQGLAALSAVIRTLDSSQVLAQLDRAVGKNARRHRSALLLLSDLGDAPGVRERIASYITDAAPDNRRTVIQLIEQRDWKQLAFLLNTVMTADPDEHCVAEAIRVAGALGQQVNLPAILRLADQDYPGIEVALKGFRDPSVLPHLLRLFEAPMPARPLMRAKIDFSSEERVEAEMREMEWRSALSRKVIVAWGLAKHGDRKGLSFLGEMLYDLRATGENYAASGESLRAAQAMADVYGLPFKWRLDEVQAIRAWWEKHKNQLG